MPRVLFFVALFVASALAQNDFKPVPVVSLDRTEYIPLADSDPDLLLLKDKWVAELKKLQDYVQPIEKWWQETQEEHREYEKIKLEVETQRRYQKTLEETVARLDQQQKIQEDVQKTLQKQQRVQEGINRTIGKLHKLVKKS